MWVELECMYGTRIFLRSTVQRQRCSDESKNRQKKWGEGCSQVHHDLFCNVQDIVRWSLTNIKSSLVVRHILNTYQINCGFLSPERSRNNTRDKLRYHFWRVWYHRSYFFFGRLFVLQKCDGHLTMSSRVVTSFILLTVSNFVGPPSPLRSHKYHLPPPSLRKFLTTFSTISLFFIKIVCTSSSGVEPATTPPPPLKIVIYRHRLAHWLINPCCNGNGEFLV